MNLLGKNRVILTIGVCLAAGFMPTTGYAQPGRTYTPPPAPPPPPRPVYTPPPSPPNFQSMYQQVDAQRNQAQARYQQDRDTTTKSQFEQLDRDRRFNGTTGGTVAKNGDLAQAMEVVVTTVEPNTQGARLGLKKGDILVSYVGEGLQSFQQVQDLVQFHAKDNQAIELVVSRNNEILQFNVQPGRLGVVIRAQKAAIR